MEGWIKLYRKMQEHWLWTKKRKFSQFEAWIYILFKANHKETKTMFNGELITVKKGSFITSEVQLAKDWNWDRSTVRKFLVTLEKDKMILKNATSKYTSISIENWELYQNVQQQKQQQNNIKTTSEQHQNNTNKNVKNIKNNNNIITTTISDSRIDGLGVDTSDSRIDGLEKIIDFYNNNIGAITPFGLQVLEDYTKEMSVDVVIYAMQISVEANKRTIKYIKAILNNWQKAGIKTLSEAKEESKKPRKKENDTYEQRNYENLDFLYQNR